MSHQSIKQKFCIRDGESRWTQQTDNQVLKELRQNFLVLVELYPGALRGFIDLLISVFSNVVVQKDSPPWFDYYGLGSLSTDVSKGKKGNKRYLHYRF